jgi:hypothetical protein
MSFFMRYVTRDDHRLTLERLEAGLHQSNRAYRLARVRADDRCADLNWSDDRLGELCIYREQDVEFAKSLALMRDRTTHSSGDLDTVIELLDEAKALVTLEVVWEDREAEITQELLDPLWTLLCSRWDGLLEIEGDGWHDPIGQILKYE